MTDPLKNIKDEIIAAVQARHPQVLPQVKMEITLASMTDAIDGKGTALNTIYNIWKNNRTKKGNLNKSNSWIAYGVGLTDARPPQSVDPLPWRRAFARAGFPDIDSDFEDARREEVIEHIVETYGRENVGNIGTYGTLHMKSVVRALVKVVDAAGSFFKGKDAYRTDNKVRGDEIIAALPKPQGAKLKWTTDEGEEVEIKTVADAYKYVPDFTRWMDKYPDIMAYAKHIEGLSSQFSTHASGIIIANEPLRGLAPLRPVEKTNWRGEKIKSFSTQFPYEDCETIGLIKFDVLAIKMLSIVKGCIELIEKNHDILLDIENLPLTDARTFRLFQTGNLTGVFQCEGYGMQKTCREMGISTFDDIMAAIALYRPGPMASIPEYIARKHGEKPVEYFHPSLEPYVKPYLKSTYGLLCFEESSPVYMADGSVKAIRDVRIGDMLHAVDLTTNSVVARECHGCSPTRFGEGVTVTTGDGSRVTVTEDHKLYTNNGWKAAGSLDKDHDLIACAWNTPPLRHPSTALDVLNLGEKEDVAYLLGLCVGDAQIRSGITLCCGPDSHATAIERWIASRLPSLKTRKFFHCRSWYLGISCPTLAGDSAPRNRRTLLGKLIDDLGLRKTCYEKTVPDHILTASAAVRSSFVAGLFDGDGCLPPAKRKACHFTSVSPALRDGCRRLLRSLGVRVRLKGSRVYVQDAKRLKEVIGDRLVIKRFECDGGLTAARHGLATIGDALARRDLSKGQRSYLTSSSRTFVTTALADRVAVNNDLTFQRIASIERVENKQFYGIAVDDVHNLLVDGIVAKNCYQEQIMQICNVLGGFSLSDAYVVIKSIGKKKIELMAKYRSQFVSGAVSKGVPVEVVEQYWDKFIVPFADYAFNIAHSCCYGYNSYMTAYLKANYKVEYLTASLNVESERKKWKKVVILEKDCHRNRIELIKRDINTCKLSYEIVSQGDPSKGQKPQIRPSILCQGMTHQAAQNIVANAPYSSLRDFANRTASCVDTTTVSSLAEAGFFPKGKGDKIVREFEQLRADLKKMRKKGLDSEDMFEGM